MGPEAVAELDTTFVSATHVSIAEETQDPAEDDATYDHPAAEAGLEDYAHVLAFLPDLTETSPTTLGYSAPNVQGNEHTSAEQSRLVAMLRSHEKIMIASGNALPLPAYGVVCDIDVQGHPPIKQRARRVPLHYLQKLYELLKGLLKTGLITFSDSPWASLIVIVLKKNGKDIRLCIDYKRVNAITAIMEYAMPLVDDLLTELGHYRWFCSLDAAIGFWVVMTTLRARKTSAFVCALGHFEWLRMPFGLKNAPMIYQRIIDNVLWGFVPPNGGWKRYAERMHEAELQAIVKRRETDEASLEAVMNGAAIRTTFTADDEASRAMDPLLELVNSPETDMFSTVEPDESSLVPVLERRSFVDEICFGGETFDSWLATLDRLLARFEECKISVSFTKSFFFKSKVNFLSHEVSRVGIRAGPKKMQVIAALPFPTSRKGMQSFLGALYYYGRFIQEFAVYGAALYQLKDGDFDETHISGPRAEGRGDELSPCGERGSRLATDAEGVLHDARWQAYQSVHEDFYPGVVDQVEDTVSSLLSYYRRGIW
ncbi:hypothetical protein PC129_g18450 [Phytophthora cactorum]|uniref:Reverse transcriptase domain-containing protein n=1 Tax=Phytophthora cactorum TaxID=29920 RepID=A0A329SLL8_9STRA|nr:hypothetical protein Pcac1_g26654 [Phytophthora cactorum]KAG2798164.1 hypothetical protein PC112_g21475 [Phytophthora cactorum]KAG2877268.1 hypothetical protein PC114_g23740 [Phytophthora cactorum]KAG2884913.1 hypothetical protein PC115_g21177 [Phytophthora cactorum]KAG2894119.1 hypothetical protein PC117_g23562 [Phytophthora cactorum]